MKKTKKYACVCAECKQSFQALASNAKYCNKPVCQAARKHNNAMLRKQHRDNPRSVMASEPTTTPAKIELYKGNPNITVIRTYGNSRDAGSSVPKPNNTAVGYEQMQATIKLLQERVEELESRVNLFAANRYLCDTGDI